MLLVSSLPGERRREHIIPILAALHWLPMNYRVSLKILLFVFNVLMLSPRPLSLSCSIPALLPGFSADQLLLEEPSSKRKLIVFLSQTLELPPITN